MDSKQLKDLIQKQQSGQLTEEEKAILDTWYIKLAQTETVDVNESDMTNRLNTVWAELQAGKKSPQKVYTLWPRIAAAASILILLGTGAYFIAHRQNEAADNGKDIVPYSAMATLRSGGKVILLDKTANGKIAQTSVTKSSGEQLSYEQTDQTYNAIYDTIQIPAGGRPYTIKLTDGSKITLNAATTLRYPEAFSKNRKEKIELINGEIYAEVVHNAAAPLQIKASGQTITDIGTEFNIAAYPDELDSRTTLVEGAVKVSAAGKETTLSPGNQAILTANGLTNSPANLMMVTAWKDGLFRFNGEHIDAIMRELARWYNIDVKYEGEMTHEVFYGRVARKRNISEVLRILERSKKVYFKIEGRRVTVLSK